MVQLYPPWRSVSPAEASSLEKRPPRRSVTLWGTASAGVLSPRMGRSAVCSGLLYFLLVIITPFMMDSFQKATLTVGH